MAESQNVALGGGFYRRFGKRLADVVLCSLALIVLSPLLLIVAVLVKVESRGPVLFAQERPGRKGRPFQILKFRSMRTFEDSYDPEGHELTNEQRITRVGRVLRRTSIDELPQLVNIVRGEMSLVGPRPALQYQVDRYDATQRRRLDERPGLTGLAQVSGRNSLTWEEKIDLDLRYVRDLSLALDFSIVLRTVGVLFNGAGLTFEKYDRLSEHNGDLRRHIGEKKGAE